MEVSAAPDRRFGCLPTGFVQTLVACLGGAQPLLVCLAVEPVGWRLWLVHAVTAQKASGASGFTCRQVRNCSTPTPGNAHRGSSWAAHGPDCAELHSRAQPSMRQASGPRPD